MWFLGVLYCIMEDKAGSIAVILAGTWKRISKQKYDEKDFMNEVVGKLRILTVPC